MRYAKLPSFSLSLTLTYILWLCVYGLLGAGIALTVLLRHIARKPDLLLLICSLLTYILSLFWHPLFYSAQFVFAAMLVLFFAMVSNVVALIKSFRKSLRLTAISFIALLIQIYFLCFTFNFSLLN